MKLKNDCLDELLAIKQLQHSIQRQYNRLNLASVPLIVPGFRLSQTVNLQDIQVIYQSNRIVHIMDCLGNTLKTNKISLPQFEESLSPYPQFIRSHRNYLVNLNQLDYFAPSPTDSRGRSLFFKKTGNMAPLSANHAKKALDFFGITSLVHVEPWDKRQQAILKEKLRLFHKEIKLMSKEEILQHFKFQSTNELNVMEFMANVIWEYFHLIQKGKREPIEGNIRTFWYVLKPTLNKVIKIDSRKHYQVMIDVFKKLIVLHKLFKYSDFGFVDQGQHFYSLGERYPHIIFLGEKTGHYLKLKRIQEEYGVTIMASGGMPSVLTAEYFAAELSKKVDFKTQSVYLITIVDYNPSGAIIIKSFERQLVRQGIDFYGFSHLLLPQNFTPEELEHITEDIPMASPSDKTKAKNWLKAGGGIAGKLKGIETEALILDFERMRELFQQAFDQSFNQTQFYQSGYRPLAMEVNEHKVLSCNQ